MRKIFPLIYFFSFIKSFSQANPLAQSFANKGVFTNSISEKNEIFSIAALNNNEIYFCGSEHSTISKLILGKINSQGKLNQNFGNKGQLIIGNDSQLFSGKKIAIVNNAIFLFADIYQNLLKTAIIKFDLNGNIDKSFAQNGILWLAQNENFLAIDMVYSSGYFFTLLNELDFKKFKLVCFDVKGNINKNFGTNGELEYTSPTQTINMKNMLITLDNKLLVCGSNSNPNYSSGIALQYLIDGKTDNGFGNNGIKKIQYLDSYTIVNHVIQMPDSNLIFTGYAAGKNFDFMLIQTNKNGQEKSTLGKNGYLLFDYQNFENRSHTATIWKDSLVLIGGTVGGGAGDTLMSNAFFAWNYNTKKLHTSFGNRGIFIYTVGKSGDQISCTITTTNTTVYFGGYSLYPPDDPIGFVPKSRANIFKFSNEKDTILLNDCIDFSISNFMLYPNPGVNDFVISFINCTNKLLAYQYSIYDATGKIIYTLNSIKHTINKIPFSLANYAPATYIIKVKINNISYSKKIIKL